jgi:cytochrome c553
MLRHGVRVTISSLALCVASSAGAQGNLDQGKTAAELYASNCATCHESLASIRNTKSFFELKSFLSQHYTSNSEAAANLAAYLKGQDRASVESQRLAGFDLSQRGWRRELEAPARSPPAGPRQDAVFLPCNAIRAASWSSRRDFCRARSLGCDALNRYRRKLERLQCRTLAPSGSRAASAQ